ncbi:right-handed parallel beta-helix repeat-containing protein [Chitinophagaceae bacterium LB-8]|uniref:Right-handed parallel beta-helix repeat-containing protein n=1 Tax=Paraflavisolibacter caeni TaxID=2982496 RepID=A0A9X2XTU7_9BACT|nr:right-handed parallel beta-helix repeat-containing protein [Paraflavisolibacter caeni]MCU7548252.1 right-handed parallel beta-helix repeat-containing protein [Paraflavisolibacter caeni]
MNKLTIILLIIVSLQANATDYYFSNRGSDATGNGSQAAPYASIEKLNTLNLNPGDRVFFKRGDTFYGSITCGGSGTSGNNIVFSAYGNGAKPIITGFTTLSKTTSGNWTQISTVPNIWETTNPVNNGLSTELRIVTVDGRDMEMGRYPNHTSSWGGYLKYENHDGDSAIIDNELPTTTNWTGARIVIKYASYMIDTAIITQHIASGGGSRLSFDPEKIKKKSGLPNNWGYIICNDPRTLDVHGEWYYDKSTKKLRICLKAGTTPANYTIKVSSIAKTFTATDRSYIVVDDIRFEGANEYGISFQGSKNGSSNTVVQNCDVQYCGLNGLHCGVNTDADYNWLVLRNFIADCHDVSVYARNTRGVTVYGNTIKRNGLLTTMGGVGTQALIGVWCARSNYTLRRNYIDSIGYVGTRWTASDVMIDSNYITNFTLVIDDGGGTYSGNGGSASNRKVLHNVIVNGLGNAEGTNRKDFRSYGIYLDNSSNNVEVAYNIVGNCKDGAFYLHNSKNINVHDNLFYGSSIGQRQVVWICNDLDGDQNMISQLQFKHNTVIARARNEWVMKIFVRPADSAYLGLIDEASGATAGTNLNNGIDSNIYARPFNQDSAAIYAIWGTYVAGSEQKRYYTNAQWEKAFGHDVHTANALRLAAPGVNDDKAFQFHYNFSTQDSIITLDRSLIDFKGSVYAPGKQYKMTPYSGAVFLDSKAAPPPKNNKRYQHSD